jgi:hypothetical protein
LEVQWSHVQRWFLHACRNKALRSEVEDLSKRGTAAQQLYDKLRRQLADAESELAQLQQLVDVTEQAQQQAAALAEQLRLHDDAEELAVREAEKQLQRLMLTQQQADTIEQQQHCGVHSTCHLVEDEAATVLQQLLRICETAGPAGATDASNWLALLHQVQQLQASNAEQFKQCMLANYQLEHLQQCAP